MTEINNIPTASVRTGRNSPFKSLGRSKLWWLTLLCVIVAAVLAWRSLPQQGYVIAIQFPEGHGLKAGDAIRHRGIDVGQVTEVRLSEDLSRIIANASLLPGSEGLAVEGTRFWIVRPQVSIAGISGLDTAVGGKYIAISPGDPGAQRARIFEGLAAPPVDELPGDGIDLVLRSDSRHGISEGAPVTWRGVDVGRVHSVALSPDARHINILVRIDGQFRRLVRSASVFWVTSGFGVDVGISGLRVDADSLSTIIRGGVSFATPGGPGADSSVNPNHVFDLHAKPKPEWTTAEASVPLIDFPLPRTVELRGKRRSSVLGIPTTKSFRMTGVLLRSDSGHLHLLTAGDGLTPLDETKPELTVDIPSPPQAVVMTCTTENVTFFKNAVWIVVSQTPDAHPGGLSPTAFRVPVAVEELCISRTAGTADQPTDLIQTIPVTQLHSTEQGWMITGDTDDLTTWIGAPAVATTDGRIIGTFTILPDGPAVIPLEQIPQ